MEKRDLYNKDKELTGRTIFKNEEIPKGHYILIVVAFIQNYKEEFLIQKRSQDKGGDWAFTGGHPKAGQSSLEGIITEVNEELGIIVEKPILFKEAKGKDTLCDLYYIKQNFNIEELVLQDEEVEKVCFATSKEIEKLYNDGLFKKGHYIMFKDCLKYLDEIDR